MKTFQFKNLTEKESKLLNVFLQGSSFNLCKIDLNKTWKENEEQLENGIWEDLVNLAKYNSILNTTNAGSRAILGSLQKKNLIKVYKNDVKDSWVTIGNKEFHKIKEILCI